MELPTLNLKCWQLIQALAVNEMKKRTYATNEEIENSLREIIPPDNSAMGYSREEQIDIAREIVRRTGKSIRINAMTIHPATPLSRGEKLFQAFITIVILAFTAVLVLGCLVALASVLAK